MCVEKHKQVVKECDRDEHESHMLASLGQYFQERRDEGDLDRERV
jgi:hypothetical protein